MPKNGKLKGAKSKKQCVYFAKGRCKRGDACSYLHGDGERTLSMQSKDIQKRWEEIRRQLSESPVVYYTAKPECTRAGFNVQSYLDSLPRGDPTFAAYSQVSTFVYAPDVEAMRRFIDVTEAATDGRSAWQGYWDHVLCYPTPHMLHLFLSRDPSLLYRRMGLFMADVPPSLAPLYVAMYKAAETDSMPPPSVLDVFEQHGVDVSEVEAESDSERMDGVGGSERMDGVGGSEPMSVVLHVCALPLAARVVRAAAASRARPLCLARHSRVGMARWDAAPAPLVKVLVHDEAHEQRQAMQACVAADGLGGVRAALLDGAARSVLALAFSAHRLAPLPGLCFLEQHLLPLLDPVALFNCRHVSTGYPHALVLPPKLMAWLRAHQPQMLRVVGGLYAESARLLFMVHTHPDAAPGCMFGALPTELVMHILGEQCLIDAFAKEPAMYACKKIALVDRERVLPEGSEMAVADEGMCTSEVAAAAAEYLLGLVDFDSFDGTAEELWDEAHAISAKATSVVAQLDAEHFAFNVTDTDTLDLAGVVQVVLGQQRSVVHVKHAVSCSKTKFSWKRPSR